MIKIEKVDVYGFEPALRGMRNAKRSWDKSDSAWCDRLESPNCDKCKHYTVYDDDGNSLCEADEYDRFYSIGKKDHELAMKLVKAGSEHAKFRRMIAVWVDITAPRYFWTQFDTYKVGTVSNSESTMHTIHQKPFELDDFSHEKLIEDLTHNPTPLNTLKSVIDMLNVCRRCYLQTNNQLDWYQLIQLLPQSYNQKRTVHLNYEVLANMYRQRKNHKLDEWKEFCKWIKTLPYSEFITGEEK